MGKQILLCEDTASLARALKIKLEKEDFKVTVVVHGHAVVKQVMENNFNLIILDLVMPGQNGFEVLKEIKDLGNRTPVIVMTNLSRSEELERLKLLGVKNYFLKIETPLAEIVERVKNII